MRLCLPLSFSGCPCCVSAGHLVLDHPLRCLCLHSILQGPDSDLSAWVLSAKWYEQCLQRPPGASPASCSAWDVSLLSGRLSQPRLKEMVAKADRAVGERPDGGATPHSAPLPQGIALLCLSDEPLPRLRRCRHGRVEDRRDVAGARDAPRGRQGAVSAAATTPAAAVSARAARPRGGPHIGRGARRAGCRPRCGSVPRL